MGYEAKLLRQSKQGNITVMSIEFDDGSGDDVIVKKFKFTGTSDGQLRDFLRGEVSRLDASKSSDYGKYVGTVMDLSMPARPTPTAEQIAEAAWFDDYYEYGRWERAIAAGLKAESDTKFLRIKAKLKAGYQESYWPRI